MVLLLLFSLIVLSHLSANTSTASVLYLVFILSDVVSAEVLCFTLLFWCHPLAIKAELTALCHTFI